MSPSRLRKKRGGEHEREGRKVSSSRRDESDEKKIDVSVDEEG